LSFLYDEFWRFDEKSRESILREYFSSKEHTVKLKYRTRRLVIREKRFSLNILFKTIILKKWINVSPRKSAYENEKNFSMFLTMARDMAIIS